MPETMRAIRLTGPVDIDGLTVSDVPIPEVRPGRVRIRRRSPSDGAIMAGDLAPTKDLSSRVAAGRRLYI